MYSLFLSAVCDFFNDVRVLKTVGYSFCQHGLFNVYVTDSEGNP